MNHVPNLEHEPTPDEGLDGSEKSANPLIDIFMTGLPQASADETRAPEDTPATNDDPPAGRV